MPFGGSKGGTSRGQSKGGTGSKGQGKGGKVPEAGIDGWKFSESRIPGKVDPRGMIIASQYFRGIPEKGKAAAKYREVYRNYERLARHSLNKEEIPLGYREYIRKYFDSVRPKENE